MFAVGVGVSCYLTAELFLLGRIPLSFTSCFVNGSSANYGPLGFQSIFSDRLGPGVALTLSEGGGVVGVWKEVVIKFMCWLPDYLGLLDCERFGCDWVGLLIPFWH